MDQPELLKFALKPGAVFLVSVNTIADGIPHYWIILNDCMKDNDEVVFLIASSKIEEAQKWCSKNNPPLSRDSLVFINDDEYEPFTKQTILNCHRIYSMPFLRFILSVEVLEMCNPIPNHILRRVYSAIKVSPVPSDEIKDTLRKYEKLIQRPDNP